MKKKPTGRKVTQKSAETKPPKILAGAKAQAYAAEITEILAEHYADVECALVHKNPFELLIATILSAQCTDERVNMVTPSLFAAGPTPAKMAALPIPQLEKLIQSTGFFATKPKTSTAAAKHWSGITRGKFRPFWNRWSNSLARGENSQCRAGDGFSSSGVVVDTHVSRISQRLGLTTATDAVKIEQDLIARLPEGEWINFSHRLIHHGRRICKARKPACDECPLSDLCPRHGVT